MVLAQQRTFTELAWVRHDDLCSSVLNMCVTQGRSQLWKCLHMETLLIAFHHLAMKLKLRAGKQMVHPSLPASGNWNTQSSRGESLKAILKEIILLKIRWVRHNEQYLVPFSVPGIWNRQLRAEKFPSSPVDDLYSKCSSATAAFCAQSWSDWHGVTAAVPRTVGAASKVGFVFTAPVLSNPSIT